MRRATSLHVKETKEKQILAKISKSGNNQNDQYLAKCVGLRFRNMIRS